MNDVSLVSEALADALEGFDPAPFGDRLEGVVAGEPLTPGVLTVRTARTLDGTVDERAAARRGAGVQVSYEGLRLTRSTLRGEDWENLETQEYHLDLLVAGTLVARGCNLLARTGVVDQAVGIVRRFGRAQTHLQTGDFEATGHSLEVDVVELAVAAGADLALGTVPPAVAALGETLATELEAEPLPEPAVLDGIEERFAHVEHAPRTD